MKQLLILFLILSGISTVHAQERIQRSGGYHQHDGFYFSFNWGPVFGNVMSKDKNYNNSDPISAKFLGTGGMADYKIGWAIRENMILHATALLNIVAAPEVITTVGNHSTSVTMPDQFEMGESMLGIGMTYYWMPCNIFLSGSIGSGRFKLSGHENEDFNGVTDRGLAMQLKIGKEWWILKNWGIGLGVSYGKTTLTDQIPNETPEKVFSNRFGILINTTFN